MLDSFQARATLSVDVRADDILALARWQPDAVAERESAPIRT